MAYKWYAIQIYTGKEKEVKSSIENLVKELGISDRLKKVVVPSEDVIEVKKGKSNITERSIYPGYVFCNLDLDTSLWHKIQSLPRVGRFIGESKKPTPLGDKDIKLILDKAIKRGDPKPKISFVDGEKVRIVDGPFVNFTGVVKEYNMEQGKLRLNVSIFGRSTPVDILYTQVEKIN